jgi:hypothetical protein
MLCGPNACLIVRIMHRVVSDVTYELYKRSSKLKIGMAQI